MDDRGDGEPLTLADLMRMRLQPTRTSRTVKSLAWLAASALAGCLATTVFWSGFLMNGLTAESATMVLQDNSQPEHRKRSAAQRLHVLAKMAIEALQEAASQEPQGKAAEDARIYLDKLRKAMR